MLECFLDASNDLLQNQLSSLIIPYHAQTPQVIFWDVMGHDNLPMMVWDMIMLIAFLYIVIVTPYLIAFSIYAVRICS